MECKCGSQFLPTMQDQKKCITCMTIDACKSKNKRMFKKHNYKVRIITNHGKTEYKVNCKSSAHAIKYILNCMIKVKNKNIDKITWIDVYKE